MKLHFILSLLVAALTIFFSCRKSGQESPIILDEYGFPPATQEGKGVFACLMDGKKWKPCKKFEFCPGCPPDPYIIVEKVAKDAVSMRLWNECDSLIEVFHINFTRIQNDSTYEYGWFKFENWRDLGCDFDYKIDSTQPYSVKLTKFGEGVIAGNFSMTLINKGCIDDTIVVKGGRFDYSIPK